MTYIANGLMLIVALLHFSFMTLEMFFWTKPLGLEIFKQTLEKANDSAVLAANQGLYNGFLAAGLMWGLLAPNVGTARQFKIFFLLCVIVAGMYGAKTVGRNIFFIQALPAILALMAIYFTD